MTVAELGQLELVELDAKAPRRRPRERCPWCGREVAIRLDGQRRRHRVAPSGGRCRTPEQVTLLRPPVQLELGRELAAELERTGGG